jgi:hypothetical protein
VGRAAASGRAPTHRVSSAVIPVEPRRAPPLPLPRKNGEGRSAPSTFPRFLPGFERFQCFARRKISLPELQLCHSYGSSAGVAHGRPRARVPHLVGSRLPRPYQFRARIQSFQAVAASFPGDSVFPSGTLAPRSRRPKRLGSKDRRSARRSPPGRRHENKYRTTTQLRQENLLNGLEEAAVRPTHSGAAGRPIPAISDSRQAIASVSHNVFAPSASTGTSAFGLIKRNPSIWWDAAGSPSHIRGGIEDSGPPQRRLSD